MRRWLAMVLCAVLLVGVLPVAAVAAGDYLNTPGLYLNSEGTITAATRSVTETSIQLFAQPDGSTGRELQGEEYRSQLACGGVISEINVYSHSIPGGTVTEWQLQVTEAGTGTITRRVNETDYIVTITFTEESSGEEYTGPFGPTPGGVADISSRALLDSDKTSGDVSSSESERFTVDGNTYFMSVAQWSNTSPAQNGVACGLGASDTTSSGNTRYLYYCICFYKVQENGPPVLVGNKEGESVTEELTKIKNAFGDTLQLRLYAQEDGPMTQYPAIWNRISSNSGWACPYVYEMQTTTMGGRWIWEATGTIDGRDLRADSDFVINVRDGISIDATQEGTNAVSYVNGELSKEAYKTNPDGKYLEVMLPPSEISGTITVPEDVAYEVFICGTDTGTGPSTARTVFKGYVVANNHQKSTTVNSIDFVCPDSGGSQNKYAVSGSAGGEIQNCSFKGYDHAIHCTNGLNFGGYDCEFTNNRVGIYIDSAQAEGNTDLLYHVFHGNDIAVQLVNMPNANPLNVVQCIFNGNTTDFDNQTGKFQTASYSFFYHGATDPTLQFSESTEDQFLPVVKGTKIGGKSPLIACPLSRDEDFSGYFIPSANAYMLNSSAEVETNLLPGKSFSVIGENGQDIGTWSFASVEEGGN